MTYKIMARYKRGYNSMMKTEVIEEGIGSKEEADKLCDEYKIAYPPDFEIWIEEE